MEEEAGRVMEVGWMCAASVRHTPHSWAGVPTYRRKQRDVHMLVGVPEGTVGIVYSGL
ncbi:hypothetical protein PAMP_014291 [Pampus punctatissimus]